MAKTETERMTPEEAWESASPRLRKWVGEGHGRSLVGFKVRMQLDAEDVRRLNALKKPQLGAFVQWAERALAEKLRVF